jgi:hypothetical protein
MADREGHDAGESDPEEEAPMPGRQEMPSTLEWSPEEAQRTWMKAHDAAVQEYGEALVEAIKRENRRETAKARR